MQTEPTLIHLEAARKALALAKSDVSSAEKEVVKALALHKVGDTLEVNGYSHQGKKMVVTHVHFSGGQTWRHGGCAAIQYTGDILKKDGTVGIMRGEHLQPIGERE